MNVETPEYAPIRLSHREILIVFSGLMLGMLLAVLDQTIVSTALPTIVGELSGVEHLSWLITAYLLTSTTSVPLYGKLSDLYGRRLLFQLAIVIFLVGSALSGGAQSMTMLIICRGLQGLGAGGIMSVSQAIVADITTPRERGRYMGYFGVVFAFASIVGPLLGGLFTDQLSWRWVFFINLPLGAVALVVTTRVLRQNVRRLGARVDFLGGALLVAAASCLLLATTWGGNQYAWRSPMIIGLLVASLVLGMLFVLNELKAPEPLLPMRLFRNRVISLASSIALITGMTMFGAIAFMPAYLQIVKGTSATGSGLRMLPLMFGMVTTSILSGRFISATGRYRVFPTVGLAVLTASLFWLSQLSTHSTWLQISLGMFFMGVGMGMVMQVMILVVQNSAEQRDMGVATASANFFRSMGGALGVAVFGSIMAHRLATELPRYLSAETLGRVGGGSLRLSPEQLRALPPEAIQGIAQAFSHAIDSVFMWAAPIAFVAFLLSLFLKEIPLRHHGEPTSETLARESTVSPPVRGQELSHLG